jgi:hypothetical protein
LACDHGRAALRVVAAQIRALHQVIIGTGGVELCEHCCLNGIRERRFSCYDHHDHRRWSAPCPTLAVLEQLGL